MVAELVNDHNISSSASYSLYCDEVFAEIIRFYNVTICAMLSCYRLLF